MGVILMISGATASTGSGSSTGGGTSATVSCPSITSSGRTVTITCATEGATIYYTLDGSTPDTGSQVYSAPFTPASDCSIKAIATLPGMYASSVASYSFELYPTITTVNQKGYWIDSQGQPATLASWEVTPMIDIPEGMTHISGKGVWWIPSSTSNPKFAFYDAGGTFISGNNTVTNVVGRGPNDRTTWGSTIISIPAGAAKVRITYPTPASAGGTFCAEDGVPAEYDVQGFHFE